MNKDTAAGNGRFCEMAVVTPQTILYKFARLSPAGSVASESAVDND